MIISGRGSWVIIGSAKLGPMRVRRRADPYTTAIALPNTESAFWTWTRKRMMQLSKRLGCKGLSETVCRLHKNTPTQSVVGFFLVPVLCFMRTFPAARGV